MKNLTRKLSHSLRSLGRAKSGAPLIKNVRDFKDKNKFKSISSENNNCVAIIITTETANTK